MTKNINLDFDIIGWYMFAGLAVLCITIFGVYAEYNQHEINLEAVKQGLVQEKVDNKIIWVKPEE